MLSKIKKDNYEDAAIVSAMQLTYPFDNSRDNATIVNRISQYYTL